MADIPSQSRGDAQVGYGRPPTHTRFKPGQSGNPKGRPKGQPTVAEIFVREAARHVRVQKGDQIETISKTEAIVRKLLQKGLEGDLGAARMVLATLAPQGKELTDPQGEAAELALGADLPDDDALRRMLARFDHLRPGSTEQQ